MALWKKIGVFVVLMTIFWKGNVCAQGEPTRIFVVSSYHREYLWSQGTHTGFCAGLKDFGYIDDEAQIDVYTKNDSVETSTAIIQKAWLDSKRKTDTEERLAQAEIILNEISEFKPDVIFIGDDNAAKYIAVQFLDDEVPVVFWGLNNTPVKYGMVDNEEMPGHNITGVYQSGYYVESLALLRKIVPSVRTFAVLSVDNASGRSHAKAIQLLAEEGKLPLMLTEIVRTKDYESWQKKALELQNSVDAFFMAQYSGFKDKDGNVVSPEDVARWYRKNIKIPEAVNQQQFVEHGMLCAADDSAYNQGYEAVVIANDILTKDLNPETYPARSPRHGALMVNKHRAKELGIALKDEMGIEKIIESSVFAEDIQ